MTYLKEIGLRIPDDVQIAGIGDGVPGKIVEPKLTTVHFYYKTSGMEAAAMLADLIENDTGINGWILLKKFLRHLIAGIHGEASCFHLLRKDLKLSLMKRIH